MAKRLVILRGAPSSGKSTTARKIAVENPGRSVICSADDYFFRPCGTYDWNPSLLKNAHNWCKQKCRKMMEFEFALIVLDNTNIKKSHYQPYIEMAKKYNYEVEEVVVGEIDPNNDELLDLYVSRNAHGVPRETIKRMMEQFEF